MLTLLVFYSLSAAVASGLMIAFYGFTAARVLVLLGSLVAIVGVVSLGAWTVPSINVFENIYLALRGRDRNQLMAAAFGVGIGLPWFGVLLSQEAVRPLVRWMKSVLLLGALGIPILAAAVVVSKDVLVQVAYATGIRSAGSARAAESDFAVELFAHTDWMPVRVAISEKEDVFVSGVAGPISEHCDILRLVEDPETGRVSQTVVAEMLNRPFGLAYKDGDLFVSRSGLYTKFTDGRMEDIRTGAVTRLRDLDADGVMDFYHDIVPGLPGAQGTDYFHQNNAIAFGPDGSLYVTSGSPGDRQHSKHEWEGAILKVDPTFENVEIFATGVRNPFGLAVLPNGDVFATDQDNAANAGDEINHVVKGGHYGHPYVVDNTEIEGIISPLLRDPSANFCGLTYTETPNLPEEYHGLYVVDRINKRIMRGKPVKSGDTYTIELKPFVNLTTAPIDIAIAQSGNMYITCSDTKEVLRVRYTGS